MLMQAEPSVYMPQCFTGVKSDDTCKGFTIVNYLQLVIPERCNIQRDVEKYNCHAIQSMFWLLNLAKG